MPAANFHTKIVEHRQRPPGDEVSGQWQTDARTRVREKYPDDGDDRLKRVSSFVESFPGVRKQLEASGMGSDPALVIALADRAYSQRPRRK